MACGCCCKKKVDPANQILFKPYSERKCTDVFFCLLFIIFWLGMAVIAIVALPGGDPVRLLYGVDYQGNVCDGTFTYYPKITEDIVAFVKSGETNPLNMKLFGVCMAACPAIGDVVCTDTGNSSLISLQASLGATRLQATAKASTAEVYLRYASARVVKSNCWIVPLPTKDYFFRCLWQQNTNSNTTVTCVEPESMRGVDVSDSNSPEAEACVAKKTRQESETTSAGNDNALMDQMFGMAATMGRYVSDAQKAMLPILICGAILALILGFIWVGILQCFAWCMVWLSLWLVMFALIGGTLYAYFKAGLLSQATLNAATGAVNSAAGTTVSVDAPAELAAADQSLQTRWAWFAYFMTAVTLIMLVLIIAMRRKINTAIGIIQYASKALKAMPHMMMFPACSVLASVVLMSYWVVIAAYVYSNGSITGADLTNAASNAVNSASGASLLCPYNATSGTTDNSTGCADTTFGKSFAASNINNYLLLYHFFGLLWTFNFISGFFTMAIAGAVSYYYFSTSKKKSANRKPVITGIKLAAFKHIGSIALGSMIIAIVQLIRAILAYLDRKSKKLQDKNKVVKIIFKCLACCLWCFEKCVKYVANSAYIMVAMKGKSFCPSAFDAVMLLLKNLAQVGVLNVISSFLFVLGKMFICGFSGFLVFVWVDNDTTYTEGSQALYSFWVPVLLTLLLSYAVGSAFMEVYELTIDTVLLCYCVDVGRDGAGTEEVPYYASPQLLKAVGKKGAVSHVEMANRDSEDEGEGAGDDLAPATTGGNKLV